ncbi:MAG: dienelactone hydrolase family protein [Pseudomonadales bacterium]|nr:dienelactone hydrolase family protein [Pseudomonadales bacterium]
METIIPSGTPSGAVLIIHSWWGLTDSFRTYGSYLADAGYLVGLTDLFDGQTARTEARARQLRASSRRTPMYRTLGADIASLRSIADFDNIRTGIVGFSMGGHWAVWLSQRPEYDVTATVLYYAARAGDFSHCRSSVLAHFAEQDPWVSTSARKNMERAISKSGCSYRACDYPGTEHWFAETERSAEFNGAAARLALKRDLHHFDQNLKSQGLQNG